MQGQLFDPDRPLPELLTVDIGALLSEAGDGSVSWTPLDAQDEATERRFTLRKVASEERIALALEFRIPAWMTERGVLAILPAHLVPTECRDGHSATVELGARAESEWRAELTRLCRTCARLMNELWGRTDAVDVASE